MTPEAAIYDRIKTVTPNVSPTQPDANIDLPQLVYTVTASEPQRTLSGSGSLVKHSVQIESYAETSADANALLAGVRAVLDGYAGGNIHRAFWTGQDTQPEDDAYHGTATYTVWMTSTNIVPTVGANTIITTGQDFIELEACDHVLRLDCDGLTLDDGPVGGGGSGLPSQSGQGGEYLKTNGTTATWEPLDIPTEFARKDTANTFSEPQNFGTIEVDQINGGAADFTGSVEAVGGFIKGGVEIQNFDLTANHTFSGNNSFTGGNDFQGQVAFTDTTTFLGPVNAINITATGSIDAETSLSTNGGLSCGSLTCYGNGLFSGYLASDDGLSTSEVNATSVVTPDIHNAGALAVSALGPNGTTGVYSDPTENAEKVTVNVADIAVVEITGTGISSPGFFKGGLEIRPTDPRSYTFLEDECMNTTDALTGVVANVSGGSVAVGTAQPNRPGVITLSTGATATGRANLQSASASVRLGGGRVRMMMMVQIPTASDGTNTYAARFGLGDGTTEHTDGVFYRYTHAVNSGNWECVTRNNGTETVIATALPAANNAWQRLELEVNAAGTQAQFWIDGASQGTTTTNIPTAAGRETALTPASINKTVGTTARTLNIDYWNYYHEFTTQR